jgi:cell division inhibitor SepF
MSVFDKFLSAIKLNEDDLDDDEYFDEADEDDIDDNRPQRRIVSRDEEEDDLGLDAYERSRPASDLSASRTRRSRLGSSKVSAFRPRRESADSDSSGNFSVCVIKPRDMEDALEIAKMLIAHCTVILNLEGLDLNVSQRIFDFASGACCAIRGNLDKISNYIFVLTPQDVDISGEFQEILTGTFDPGFDLDDDL